MSKIGTGSASTRLLLLAALLLPAMGVAIAQSEPAPADADAPQIATEAVAEDTAAASNESTPDESVPATTHPGGYSDLRRISPVQGNAAAGQAKSELCAACHSPTGISVIPIYPNLAGQRATYMYWELVQFKRGAPDSPMAVLVADLSDQDMRDFAAYYASLDPAAAEPADTDVGTAAAADPQRLQRGEQLYLSGDPGKGIPACQGCHGADARGHPDALKPDRNGHTPYAAYPALRGQQVAYLQGRLGQYHARTLHDSTTDFVMQGVAQRLDEDSIQSLSEWLSSLPH